MKFIHLSDIHIRLRDRQEEYKEVFENLYKKIKEQNPDRILITGDIVHSKNTMSPELIDITREFLYSIQKLAPLDLIIGNHDMNISNRNRMDSLTPIVDSVLDKISASKIGFGVNFYKDTGYYNIPNSNFVYGVFSLLDGKSLLLTKNEKEDDKVYIALYHGPIDGCVLDQGYVMNNAETNISAFKNFDFVMLGDIHKRQFMRKDKTAAYPGSLIQQNFGEELDKGFLVWDIDERTKKFDVDFISVENKYGFFTLEIDGEDLPDIKLPEKCKMRVIWPLGEGDLPRTKVAKLNSLIYKKYNPISMNLIFRPVGKDGTTIKIDKNNLDLGLFEVHEKILRNWLNDEKKEVVDKIVEKDKEIFSLLDVQSWKETRGHFWSLKKLALTNFMSYGPEETIFDFEKNNGIIGIFGDNRVGKSTILDALLFVLFNKTTRGVKNENIPNTKTKDDTAKVWVIISIDGIDYKITRTTTKKKNGSTNTLVFSKWIDSKWEDISEDDKRFTDKLIKTSIGTYEDFITTTFSTSNKDEDNNSEFIHLKPAPRTDTIIRFLGLDVFTQKYSIANKQLISIENNLKQNTITNKSIKLREAREALESFENRLSSLSGDHDAILEKIDENRSTISELKSKRVSVSVSEDQDELESKLKLELISLGDINSNIDFYSGKTTELVNKIKEIELAYVVDKDQLNKLIESKDEYKNLSTKIEKINNTLTINKTKLKQLSKDVENGSQCPVEYDEKHKGCIWIKSYFDKKGIISSLTDETYEIFKEKQKLDEKCKELKYSIGILEEQNSLRERLIYATNKADTFSYKTKELLGKKEAKEILIRFIESKIKIAKDNKDAIKTNKSIDSAVLSLETALKDNIKIEKEIQAKIGDLKVNIAVEKKNIDSIKSEIEEIRKLDEEYNILKVYCAAMKRDGIPTLILSSFIPQINYEINRVLSSVIDFSVNLEVQDTNNIEIIIRESEEVDDSRPAKMASGMEKLLMNFSIRYALLQVSSLNKSDSWYIDEGFGVLHANYIGIVSAFLENIKETLNNIVIITHVDSLKDIANYSFNVEKIGGISYVKSSL